MTAPSLIAPLRRLAADKTPLREIARRLGKPVMTTKRIAARENIVLPTHREACAWRSAQPEYRKRLTKANRREAARRLAGKSRPLPPRMKRHSDEHIRALQKAALRNWQSPKFRRNQVASHVEFWTPERRAQQSRLLRERHEQLRQKRWKARIAARRQASCQ